VREWKENFPGRERGKKTGVGGDRIRPRMLRTDRRQSLGKKTDQFNRQFVTQ
jgi:hypothetical protein